MLLKVNKPDAAHNRQLPTGRELALIARQIQARYWDEVQIWLPHASSREPPDPLRWIDLFVEVAMPAMRAYYARGAREAASVLRQLLARALPPRLFYRTGGAKGAFLEMMTKERLSEADLEFDVYNPLVSQAIEQATFDFAQSTLDTMGQRMRRIWRDYLRQTLTQGLEAGDTLQQLARDVGRIIRDPDRALTVAATEASRAVHAGQAMLDEQSGVVAGKKWLASADACDVCLPLNGKEVGLNENFVVDGTGPYAAIEYPPAHPRCLLPGTLVTAPGLVGGFRAWYRGAVHRIEFAGGESFTCTEQHKLLTPNGFVAVADLMDGDDVIDCCLGERAFLGRAYPQDNRKPAAIEQVVHSLAIALGVSSRTVPAAAEHLHGDGAFCQGEIDIVRADRFLGYDGNIARRFAFRRDQDELITNVGFNANTTTGFFNAESLAAKRLECLWHATHSGMSVSDISPPLFRRHALHADSVSFGEGSRHDAIFQEATTNRRPRNTKCQSQGLLSIASAVASQEAFKVDDDSFGSADLLGGSYLRSVPLESFANSGATEADRLAKVLQRFPGEIATRKVNKIECDHYEGPVYDLETETNMYIIGTGLVSSNCQCTYTAVLKEEFRP